VPIFAANFKTGLGFNGHLSSHKPRGRSLLSQFLERRLETHTESFRFPFNAESAGRVAHAFWGGLNHAACVLRWGELAFIPNCERLRVAGLTCLSLLPAMRWHGLGRLRETGDLK
jgi:hypothetical protein